ncbi:MAG: DinB family protein [Dehalococcoidia bacterium]
MKASPETSIEVMSRTASLLRGLLDGLPEELLTVRDEEGWGPSTVVAHMVAIEPVALVDRVRRILEEERPAVPDIDESANLEESGLRNAPLAELLGRFERQRLETLEFLHGIDGAGWQRVGMQSVVGEITAENVLHHFANHDLLHLEQISALVRRPINDGRGAMRTLY